jgi:N-acetylmuramoyl-L-alanine amidase
VIVCALPPSSAAAQQADARLFPQTGYRVADDAFWTYFRRRGAVRTFGYPVSNTFTLQGFRVQIFQRAILQLQPSGGVAIMNVLDDGLLPYTAINGSVFPGIDPEVVRGQPKVGEANYHARALQFVKDTAPDVWQGTKVDFFQTFIGAVRAEDASPEGGGSAGLLLGFNLEIWGLPTSKPTADPTNAGFVYQRFQRGIMHYDASCRCTQGLLLADYLKSMLTLSNLPPDLAAQAQRSPFFGQLDPGRPGWLKRPSELPTSDLTDAFNGEVAALGDSRPSSLPSSEPPASISAAPSVSPASPGKATVFVDAGHGGKEIGASATSDDGKPLIEKELNLKVATRLVALLREVGLGVVASRTADAQVNTTRDLNNDGKVNLTDDLQARVDAANAAKADLLISVHFNGVGDPSKKGTQTFYSDGRPFATQDRALAELVQAGLVKNIRAAGYQTDDRGATSDSRVLGQGSHYYLLGPVSPTIRRPSAMPGVIGEALFLTNPEDAQALRQDKVLEGVARGYAEAITAYFAKYPQR